MSNNVVKHLSNGMLAVIERGFQTKESMQDLNGKVSREVKRIKASGKPALILVDLTGIIGHDKGAELEGAKVIKLEFDAMAIFTQRRTDRMTINMIILMHNARDRIRTFKTLSEASAWLKEFET